MKREKAKSSSLFSPIRDWLILLVVGVAALVCLIGYGLWVYWQVEHASYDIQMAAGNTSGHLRYLEETLTSAAQERETFEALKASAPLVRDPSL